MQKRKWMMTLMLVAAFVLAASGMAEGAAPTVSEARTVIGENRVAYPVLTDMEDDEIQKKINDDIVTRAEIPAHFVTLSTLRAGGWGLVVDYEAFLQADVLSVTIHAKGTMTNGREGQKYTAVCYDLNTGETITLDEIFVDAASAVAWMEERAENTLMDELFGYLENSEISPLPVENFALDADGMTFYYPSDRFSLLSGDSGACQFYYDELTELLDWEGVLARIGVEKTEAGSSGTKEKIAAVLETGRLPHVPVAIGDEMISVVEKYRLLREPDQYPGGKYYQMEAPPFRQVLLLSDALGRGYENSKVLGIQSMRGNLYGIQAGKTMRDDWRAVLGEPENTVAFSESLAYDYALPVGESDFYAFGNYQLRLHADGTGLLHSIRLTQAD